MNHHLNIIIFLTFVIGSFVAPKYMLAVEIEAFTQPYRSVDVPAAEMGVIARVLVEEGTRVRTGQLLAQLNDSVLQSSLALAAAAMRASSSQQSAEAELTLCEEQLRSYRELQGEGNASQREVDRAETNYWQATTRLRGIREDTEIRELEHQRISAQIAARKIESPLDGIVVRIYKDAGEFVSPTDPVLMQVVQLDRLRAIFSVPVTMIDRLEKNQRISLQIGGVANATEAVIETISPIADAESASVRVNVRIENPAGKLRSGVICRWEL